MKSERFVRTHTILYIIREIGGREKEMSEVRVRENESLDSALRRFKRQCAMSGIMSEVRKRDH